LTHRFVALGGGKVKDFFRHGVASGQVGVGHVGRVDDGLHGEQHQPFDLLRLVGGEARDACRLARHQRLVALLQGRQLLRRGLLVFLRLLQTLLDLCREVGGAGGVSGVVL
jgi:hypothetical protein